MNNARGLSLIALSVLLAGPTLAQEPEPREPGWLLGLEHVAASHDGEIDVANRSGFALLGGRRIDRYFEIGVHFARFGAPSENSTERMVHWGAALRAQADRLWGPVEPYAEIGVTFHRRSRERMVGQASRFSGTSFGGGAGVAVRLTPVVTVHLGGHFQDGETHFSNDVGPGSLIGDGVPYTRSVQTTIIKTGVVWRP